MSKTRNEYLEILNLDAQASAKQIEERFNELYSDFQIRLTNAPTPNLKKLYQKNLQELEEAYANLTDSKSGTASATDLPSSRPVQSTQKTFTTPEPSPLNNPQVVVGRNAKKSKQEAQKTAAATGSGISFTAFIITIVVALAGMALLTTLYLEGKKEVAAAEKEAAENSDFLKLKDVIKNGKFKVENRTSEPLIIYITHITFFNNQGQLQEYKFLGGKGNPEPVSMELKPGKNVSLNQYDGAIKWDGSVVSYAMLVYKKGGISPTAVYSGIWLHEWPENKLVITE